MEITITLPEPKFKPGDFVQVTRPDADYSVLVRIESFIIGGQWAWASYETPIAWINDVGSNYQAVVQNGVVQGRPVRPGRVLFFPVLALDAGAYNDGAPLLGEKVEFIGEPVPAEDPDKFFELEETWKALHNLP